MIDASSPSEDASVPDPIHTGLELALTWGDRVVVASAPASVITTDSAKDVKVVVGSIMVVGKVVVYVVRLADAGGIVLDVDRLENEAEGEGVNDGCEEDLVEPGSVPEGINTDPLLVVYHSCCADTDAEDMSCRSKARST
jgi:hypothetical protein